MLKLIQDTPREKKIDLGIITINYVFWVCFFFCLKKYHNYQMDMNVKLFNQILDMN